jgi:pimeloyl-ACP methyl ester carboxylesterase
MAVPAAASAQAPPPIFTTPCPKLQPDARCGHVEVPLDRSRLDGRMISIGFVVLPRTKPAEPGQEPVFVVFGGPGDAASANSDAVVRNFGGVRDRHDVVMVDYRGEGGSDPIDCTPLQHLTTNSMSTVIRAVGACGSQLGDASDLYGAGDVADDIDAVRAALGYATIDLYGVSYGTVQAQAYLLRHREHVRALILNGAIDPLLGPARSWVIGASNARAIARDVALVCSRSQSCSSANPHPARVFATLDRRLRHHPLDVVARDVTGAVHHVHIDERTLVQIATATDPAYLNDGELVAAATALRHGDATPLSRIAANNTVPLFGDGGDPAISSVGANAATQCTDLAVPWDLSAPFERRRVQFETAIRQLTFGPFSPDAFANTAGFSGYCLHWPTPHHRTPVFTPQTRFPDVPVLIIAATLDTSTTLEQNESVARRFPHAQLVVLRNGGHPPGVFAGCVPDIYARFLRTLHAGDTSCVRRDDPDRPAVGTFARRVSEAPPAVPSRGDRSADAQRRLATVLWLTAQDALRQSFRLPDMAHGTGVGLRAGRFTETFNFDRGVQRLALHELRFSEDVAVTGSVKVDANKGIVTGRLSATGRHGRRGAVTIAGHWLDPQAGAGPITIRGHLDGYTVALTTPGG